MTTPEAKPTAWLLSAYHADSHAYWADWLTRRLDGYHWRPLTLPGRHFRWRIRGNPLSWLDCLPSKPPALLVATSMVDLATLKGLHPSLAGVPSLYYVHENQFVYPRSADQHDSVDPQMVQLYAALAADRVLFNSHYNQESFLQGVDALLARLPDRVPAGVADRLRQRSAVLPVPIVPIPKGDRQPGLIVWPHRWDYDKAPQVFAAAIERLLASGVHFHLALLGPRAEATPSPLASLREMAGDRILVDSYLSATEYRTWLGRADIVVSSAIHEFQGLATLQGCSAGATPLVPDALCYAEQYPADCRYPAGDSAALAQRLAAWLESPQLRPVVDVAPWYESALLGPWQRTLQALLD